MYSSLYKFVGLLWILLEVVYRAKSVKHCSLSYYYYVTTENSLLEDITPIGDLPGCNVCILVSQVIDYMITGCYLPIAE